MQLRIFSLLPLVALVTLMLSAASQVHAWNKATRQLEDHVESMNGHIKTLHSSFVAYLGGDLGQTGTAVEALGNLTTDLHSASNDLSVFEIKIQGEDVKDILAGLQVGQTEVSKVVNALIGAKELLKSSGNDFFIKQFLPPLGRAFNGFSTLVAIQADKKYAKALDKTSSGTVAWINFGLVSFGLARISADWLPSFGPAPCDSYNEDKQHCKKVALAPLKKRGLTPEIRADRM
ncbi:Cell wall galactomannoprotein [Ceraceosorus bombacis]|uniref:Cell wall galactomannoprotein n=1 Tax=Ceraceosorus bombacis TaxID=401625 RepID=A0A0N7L994_9BASI|nr:Cell wall galactomannoprotein [Ceraceosorus bombacis]